MDGSQPSVLSQLPERCVSRERGSGRLVMLQRGQPGFRYVSGERSPEDYNRAMGLSYEQVEAMEYGALFGYDAELADPAIGRPLPAAPKAPPPKPAPKAELPEDLGNFAPWFQEALRAPKASR